MIALYDLASRTIMARTHLGDTVVKRGELGAHGVAVNALITKLVKDAESCESPELLLGWIKLALE